MSDSLTRSLRLPPLERPTKPAPELPPLRVISPYVMALVIAQVIDARSAGHSTDNLARHLWGASARALAGKTRERYELAEVLHAWAHLIQADADAEA